MAILWVNAGQPGQVVYECRLRMSLYLPTTATEGLWLGSLMRIFRRSVRQGRPDCRGDASGIHEARQAGGSRRQLSKSSSRATRWVDFLGYLPASGMSTLAQVLRTRRRSVEGVAG